MRSWRKSSGLCYVAFTLRHFVAAISITCFVGLLPSTSEADPVTIQFQVTVTNRFCASACAPIPDSFPMAMTVDTEVTRSFDSPRISQRLFGTPTFALPFDMPETTPGLDAFFGDQTQLFTVFGRGWWHSNASAVEDGRNADGSSLFRVTISTPAVRDAERPDPTWEFYQTLIAGNHRNRTLLHYDFRSPNLGEGFVQGTVVATNVPTPVPEPATMALVGAGFGAMAFRRLRSQRPR